VGLKSLKSLHLTNVYPNNKKNNNNKVKSKPLELYEFAGKKNYFHKFVILRFFTLTATAVTSLLNFRISARLMNPTDRILTYFKKNVLHVLVLLVLLPAGSTKFMMLT
jgi:hypothetical protein